MDNKSSVVKKAFTSSVPVLAGYLVLGIGFGVILSTKGYGIGWAFLMSLTIYAGSLQYVAINLITGGASFLTVALTSLLVNARHLFYGISMVDRYRETGKAKPYLIFGLTDETYSLVVAHKDSGNKKEDTLYFFLVTLFDQIYWITGSILGSILGRALPFDSTGIDFALTALFVTIFVDQWRSTKDHLPAILGVVITVVCRLIFGASNFLIPTMIALTALLLLIRKREEARL